jgi:acetyl-CoA synthetase
MTPSAEADALIRAAGFKASPDGYVIELPERANIAADTVTRHALGPRAQHAALIFEEADGTTRRWSFAELDRDAAAFAGALHHLGVRRGDPVGIHTGMRPETGIAHLAIYKLGAIAVTLSQLYGPDTLRHILEHSGARTLITTSKAWDPFRGQAFGAVENLVVSGGAVGREVAFEACLRAGAGHVAVDTRADDPALLMYTSGSTGLPKGLLHGHRILHAYLPTVQLFYDLSMDDPDAAFWTPADWAWVGGLLDLLLPAWAHGQTVVASEHRFDPEWAFDFMSRHRVSHSFMTPTALTRLAEVEDPRARWNLAINVVCTGGESLPSSTLRWTEEALRIICNEFYGLTEFNHLIGSCRQLYPAKAGSMGRAYPGHRTTLVDDDGREVADGEVGEIVARGDDPTLFLGYWRDEKRTEALRLGPWLRTRDLAMRDGDGYFHYRGRTDDLIKSAGYRIGPVEVEDCLLKHPAVAEVAVVGVPDPQRGALVKAYVRLRGGAEPSEAVATELQAFVKTRLAAYKYPRVVEFVDNFPLTSSGKINRRALRERHAATEPGRAAET